VLGIYSSKLTKNDVKRRSVSIVEIRRVTPVGSVKRTYGKLTPRHGPPFIPIHSKYARGKFGKQPNAPAESELSFNLKKDIAKTFLRLTEMPTFALDRLSRYEHLLWRKAHQIVLVLDSLQRRKRQFSRFSTFVPQTGPRFFHSR
jgi:hypothetical protein